MRDLTDAEARDLAELQQARTDALERRDEALERLRRDGVPVVQLAEAVGVRRGAIHDVLRTRGVTADAVRAGGSRPAGHVAPAWRIRQALVGLGFPDGLPPGELAGRVAVRLADPAVNDQHDSTT